MQRRRTHIHQIPSFPSSVVIILILPSNSRPTRITAELPIPRRLLSLRTSRDLRNVFTRIDPIRVHIRRHRQVVDGGLELLSAYLAVEITDTALFVELDDDGVFVVAEEACEGRG